MCILPSNRADNGSQCTLFLNASHLAFLGTHFNSSQAAYFPFYLPIAWLIFQACYLWLAPLFRECIRIFIAGLTQIWCISVGPLPWPAQWGADFFSICAKSISWGAIPWEDQMHLIHWRYLGRGGVRIRPRRIRSQSKIAKYISREVLTIVLA
jgi:hypothetical protein